jgi:hypothetical protein
MIPTAPRPTRAFSSRALREHGDRPSYPTPFFSILLGGPRPSVEEAHSKTSCCHARRKHHTDYPTRREAYSPRFTTSKFPTQIRHMGFRPEPFMLR